MKKLLKYPVTFFIAIFFGVMYISGVLALFSSPWVPSRKKDLRRILKAIDPRRGEIIYDLGSGDARLLLYLAKNSKAKFKGIELSFFYYLLSYIRLKFSGLESRVCVAWKDFYKVPLHDADKIFLYLTKNTAQKISEKLFFELKEGTRVIAYNYPIAGWHLTQKLQKNASDAPIYIYIFQKNIKKPSFTF